MKITLSNLGVKIGARPDALEAKAADYLDNVKAGSRPDALVSGGEESAEPSL